MLHVPPRPLLWSGLRVRPDNRCGHCARQGFRGNQVETCHPDCRAMPNGGQRPEMGRSAGYRTAPRPHREDRRAVARGLLACPDMRANGLQLDERPFRTLIQAGRAGKCGSAPWKGVNPSRANRPFLVDREREARPQPVLKGPDVSSNGEGSGGVHPSSPSRCPPDFPPVAPERASLWSCSLSRSSGESP